MFTQGRKLNINIPRRRVSCHFCEALGQAETGLPSQQALRPFKQSDGEFVSTENLLVPEPICYAEVERWLPLHTKLPGASRGPLRRISGIYWKRGGKNSAN